MPAYDTCRQPTNAMVYLRRNSQIYPLLPVIHNTSRGFGYENHRFLMPLKRNCDHGTNILLKLETRDLQQVHVSKFFIARLTLQSSHRLRHRQGQTIMLLGALWQTTHCGPPSPRPEAPSAHEDGCAVVEAVAA
jgi:hypothetical protein